MQRIFRGGAVAITPPEICLSLRSTKIVDPPSRGGWLFRRLQRLQQHRMQWVVGGEDGAGVEHVRAAGEIAHHALRASKRGTLTLFLALTFLLGFLFVGLQAHEYGEAYKELGLKLSTGIYGSTFFMLTGFHGLHVTVGAIMLLVVWLRVLRGHFTPRKHFAFEAVAWYWHFVDVVWLGLFIFVYWL